ncbi:hypothetical protein R1flu_010670 [Riccia fluitans]|uniref:Uncharacterized protein n=1 Tax=Riccia fluitans TaxID=41844 RepID=A0ABD1Z6K0_9MARC
MFIDLVALHQEPPPVVKFWKTQIWGKSMTNSDWKDVAQHMQENANFYYGNSDIQFIYVERSTKASRIREAVWQAHGLLTQAEQSHQCRVVVEGSNLVEWTVQCEEAWGTSRVKREAQRVKAFIDPS